MVSHLTIYLYSALYQLGAVKATKRAVYFDLQIAHRVDACYNIHDPTWKKVNDLNNGLYAPQIGDYIDWLGHVQYRDVGNTFTYDNGTYAMLDELFSLLKHLEPVSENRVWELWLTADRGPIEAYGDYEELLEEGEVGSFAEFEEAWRNQFPDEKNWFHFAAVDDKKIGYRAVFLNHRHVIEVDPRKERSFEHDIAAFAQWLLESVKECVDEIRSGSYNERIERELPPQHRTGTIRRKDFWDIFPRQREDFFRDIATEELQELLNAAKEPGADLSAVKERLPTMTANDFYAYCAIGYRANQYTGAELSPKEQYYLHADGRDDGLSEIDPDSAEEFSVWFHDRKRLGGHPWEVCRGGNSTHIDLFVGSDERGYFLKVAGSAWTRTIEAVRFYLALRRAGLPVCLYQADLLVSRLTEEEEIGVVPEGMIPAYCYSLFPGGRINDFMNLPREKREQVAEHCLWQPLKPVVMKTLSVLRDIHKLLHSAFEQAVLWEYVPRNPFHRAALPHMPGKPREHLYPEQISRLLERCDDPQLTLAIHLAFAGTLRKGELLALTWEDVDWKNGAVQVAKTLRRVSREALEALDFQGALFEFPPVLREEKTALVLKAPKTASSSRIVFLPDTMMLLLKEHRDRQGEGSVPKGHPDLIFRYGDGRPLQETTLTKHFQSALRKAELPKVTFHSLRHSSITYKLILSAGDIKAVQGDSGHAQAEMVTEIYSHIIDQNRRVNALRFEMEFYKKSMIHAE